MIEDLSRSCHIRLPAEYCEPLIGGPPPMVGDVPGIPYRPARHFRKGRRGSQGVRRFQVVQLVIHVAECAKTRNAAEGLQTYASTMADNRVASWNYAADCDSVTQSVLEADTAHHCPPLNDFSIGVELAGRASQVAGEWDDAFSRDLLRKQAAPLIAGICGRHGIPIRTLTDGELLESLAVITAAASHPATTDQAWAEIRARHGGIVTHAQVSRVFKKSTHYDPGKGFPLEAFLDLVRGGPDRSRTGEVLDALDTADTDRAPALEEPEGSPV